MLFNFHYWVCWYEICFCKTALVHCTFWYSKALSESFNPYLLSKWCDSRKNISIWTNTKYYAHTICRFILTSRMGHNICMTSQIIRLLLRLVLLCRCCIILRYLFAPYYSYSSSFLTCLSCPFSFHTLFQTPFIYSRLNVSIYTITSQLQRKHI